MPKRIREIITPEQFDALYRALPDDQMRLLVETDPESGLRWGELIELGARDFDRRARLLSVSRVVVEPAKPFRVDGERFVVKDYPKDKEHRRVRISRQIAAKLCEHIDTYGLGPDDLLFAIRDRETLGKPHLRAVPDPDQLGLTEPNASGRQYRHGTLSAYSAAPCRCQHCKAAYAIYRAERRASGKPHCHPPRLADPTAHM